jgi:hypothetical protein
LKHIDKVYGAIGVGIAIYAALGIWFPKLRSYWKGTRIKCGAVTCAGTTLGFGSLGLLFLLGNTIQEKSRIWYGMAFIIGWLIAAIGYLLDKRNGGTVSVPSNPVPRPQGESTRSNAIVFLVIGAWFLAMLIMHMLSNR